MRRLAAFDALSRVEAKAFLAPVAGALPRRSAVRLLFANSASQRARRVVIFN